MTALEKLYARALQTERAGQSSELRKFAPTLLTLTFLV